MAEGDDSGVDGLLREFLVETRDMLDAVEDCGAALIEAPADAEARQRLLELVHSIKGACDALPLPRLETVAAAVTGAADALGGRQVPTAAKMEAILSAVGRMRDILNTVDHEGAEPEGADADLIAALVAIAEDGVPITGGDDDDATDMPPAAAELPAFVIFEAGGELMALDAGRVVWLDVIEGATLSDDFAPIASILGEDIPLRAADGGPLEGLGEGKPVIVLLDGERRVGVVVDEIIDIAADPDARMGTPVARIGPELFLEP